MDSASLSHPEDRGRSMGSLLRAQRTPLFCVVHALLKDRTGHGEGFSDYLCCKCKTRDQDRPAVGLQGHPEP